VAELAVTLGARHEARFIVEDVVGSSSPWPDRPVSPAQAHTIRELAARRLAGEPLQYVLGHWAFRSLDLLVDPRVLIPRPETEQVVEVALRQVSLLGAVDPVLVDAGTGSGAIALSLATELASSCPGGQVWAIDESADALAVAQANYERVGRHGDRPLLPVAFARGAWLTALPAALEGSVSLVVSNPPYIDAMGWPDLPGEVRREPAGALVAPDGTDGTPGLGDVEQVMRQAWTWLTRPGTMVIEVSPEQAEAATRMAGAIGYADVEVLPDLSGRPRALVGRAR
jgi:release factor glutamine methyltransferase